MWLSLLACGRPSWEPVEFEQWVPPVVGEVSTVEPVTDVFVSEAPDRVDVLLAVDPELWPAVAAALPSLVEPGLGRDWHVGVTSTALVSAAPGAIAWVDLAAPDPLPALAGAALDGLEPYGALGATWLALDQDATGFARADSELHLVAIQAADDATPPTVIDAPSWRSWWSGYRSAASGVVHAIAPADAAVLAGVADAFGPGLVPLEGVDWSVALAGVGRSTVAEAYALSRTPIEDTLELSMDDDGTELAFERDVDFTFDPVANAVAFVAFVPPPGATLTATYWSE